MSVQLFDKVPNKKSIKLSPDMSHNHFRLEGDVFLPILEFMLQSLDLRSHFRRPSSFIENIDLRILEEQGETGEEIYDKEKQDVVENIDQTIVSG